MKTVGGMERKWNICLKRSANTGTFTLRHRLLGQSDGAFADVSQRVCGLPPRAETKSASSGEPIPSGGLRVRASPATVTNRVARQRMATTRAISGVRLEKDPATAAGTTRSAPIRGKGTEYAGLMASPSPGASGSDRWSSPKAERAQRWLNTGNST